MNRACFFLALWLTPLVLQSQVVGQPQCQSHADYYRFGIGVDDICPFVDGYREVEQEETPAASAAATPEPELDLRGRAIVAVLDIDAEFSYDCGYLYYYDHYYGGSHYNPPIAAWDDVYKGAGPEHAADATAPERTADAEKPLAADAVGSADAEAAPVQERDYELECYQAYLERTARKAEGLAAETAAPASPPAESYAAARCDAYGYRYSDPCPVRERDYEQECYQVYLERTAQEAEELAAAIAAPELPSAGAYAGTRYDAYGYGYSYAYEYDYTYHLRGYPQVEGPEAPAGSSADAAQSAPGGESVTLDGAGVGASQDTALSDSLQASVAAWKARAAALLDRVDLRHAWREASHTLVMAVRQAVTVSPDWREANVFLFVFGSDLNAEPLAARYAPVPASLERPLDAVVAPETPAAETAANDDDVAPQVGSLTREQLEPLARQALAVGTEAWQQVSVALRRLAQRSLALVARDDLGSTAHR